MPGGQEPKEKKRKRPDRRETGVELRIWLKQGKEKAQTRKGKKTAGKEKRLLARILEKARKRLSRQNSTKKCVNVRGKRPQFYKKHNNFKNYVLK